MNIDDKDLEEFMRLFEKATGKRLAEDDARWHMERLVQLYRTLLDSKPSTTLGRAIGEAPVVH